MTVTNNATAADLDAAPVGSTLLDSEGDTATKLQDGGWQWGHNCGSVSYNTATLQSVWGPIRLTTPDLAPAPAASVGQVIHNATLQDLNDAPVGSHLVDRQGDIATKQANGRWAYLGWSNVKAGSVVRSFSPLTLTRAIEATTPDLAPADEPGPQISGASYDSVSKVASVRVDGKRYQMSATDRPLATVANHARTFSRDSARAATAYAQLASLLEGALKEEEAKQQQSLRDTLRAQALTEAGISRSYSSTGPSVRRLVDVAVEAKLALHKAQEAAK